VSPTLAAAGIYLLQTQDYLDARVDYPIPYQSFDALHQEVDNTGQKDQED
jgi:hypothetical protein